MMFPVILFLIIIGFYALSRKRQIVLNEKLEKKKLPTNASYGRGEEQDSDKIRWLNKELVKWNAKDIITEIQQQQILNEYAKSETYEEHNPPVPKPSNMNIIKTLSIMGAILVGLGVIMFVASNWSKIPDLIRTLMVLSVTFGTFYMGYYFSYQKEGHKELGKALLLLASLLWGASIALIGQIYHIPISENWFIFLIWGLPLLPVAYFLESTPIFMLSSGILLVWNFLFSASKGIANYYYPLIVFLVLFPISKKADQIQGNIIALGLAALYAFATSQDYLLLLIAAGLLIYNQLKKDQYYGKSSVFVLSSMLLLGWNFVFKGIEGANYIYPLIVFSIMLPLSKNDEIRTQSNIFMLLLVSIFAIFSKYDYLVLFIAIGLLIYHFIKNKQSYSISSAVAFLLWMITFSLAHENTPNYFFVIPLSVLMYVSYRTRSQKLLAINIGSFLLWFYTFLATLSKEVFPDEFNKQLAILVFSMIGITLYLIGLLHKAHPNFGCMTKIYKGFGAFLGLLATYSLSLSSTNKLHFVNHSLYFYAAVAIGAGSFLFILLNFIKNNFSEKGTIYELVGVFAILAGNFIILFAPHLITLNTIVMSCVLLLISILVILYGSENQVPELFNIGAIIFVITILTREPQTVWNFLPRSLIILSLAGTTIYLIGLYAEKIKKLRDFSSLYELIGFIVPLFIAYLLSFKSAYEKEITFSSDELFMSIAIIIGAISLCLMILNYLKGNFSEKSSKYEITAILVVMLGSFLILFAPNLATLNTIVMNGILLLISVIVVICGFENQSPKTFNFGVGLFVVLVITRYFDTLWQLLPRSISFIVSGIILLAFTYFLETKRRKVIEGMDHD